MVTPPASVATPRRAGSAEPCRGAGEAPLVEELPDREARGGHHPVPPHRELDDVHVAAEPPRAWLQVRGVVESRERRGGERRLAADSGFGHRPRPQRRAVAPRDLPDAADFAESPDPMDLHVPDPRPAELLHLA